MQSGLSPLAQPQYLRLTGRMTFFDAIKTVFRKYAEFGGRATRPEFWWFALFSVLVSAALSTLAVPRFYGGFGDGGFAMPVMGTFPNLAGLWSIAVLLPSLAVTVRRLRDAAHSWAEIFWILLPIAGAIVLIVRLADPSVTEPAAPVAPAPAPAAKAVPETTPAAEKPEA